MVESPAGWHPDPFGTHELRYFDGAAWTEHVSDQGRQGTAPAAYPAAPSTAPAPGAYFQPGAAMAATSAPAAGPRSSAATSFPLSGYSVATRVLVFVGAGLLIFGSFLPWVKASIGLLSVEKNGIDGDGVFTLGFGVAAILLFGLLRNTAGRVLTLIAAVLAAAVAFYDVVDVQQTADDLTSRAGTFTINASVGIGLWLAAMGALVLIAGVILAFRDALPKRP
jgi:Protein of unknown function (DUF2510)